MVIEVLSEQSFIFSKKYSAFFKFKENKKTNISNNQTKN
jgi:hypothetical protein